MDADLDTLATALYARVDDVLKDHPELVPWRPKVGIAPKAVRCRAVDAGGVAGVAGLQ